MFHFKLLIIAFNSCKKGQENVCNEESVYKTVEYYPSDGSLILKCNPKWDNNSNIDEPASYYQVPVFLPTGVWIDNALCCVDLIYCDHFIVITPFLFGELSITFYLLLNILIFGQKSTSTLSFLKSPFPKV